MSKLLLKKSRQFSALSLIAGAAVLLFFAFADHSRSAGAASSSAATPQSGGAAVQATAPAREALTALQNSSQSQISAEVSRASGRYDFVKAAPGAVLVTDNANAKPEERALRFVSAYGGVFGVSDASGLRPENTQSDDLGFTHVRLNQFHNGVPVFGAQLIVHMNEQGITAANGNYVADLAVDTTPALGSDVAGETALATLRKGLTDTAGLSVTKTDLAIFPVGLAEGRPVVARLAYAVEVGGQTPEQVWVDAHNGTVLARIPRHHTALYREVWSPEYRPAPSPVPAQPFLQRKEGDAPHPTPFVNNLYDFAGQTYNYYASGFGRDSFNGTGGKMISVYLINQQCPNAYWNGTSTNYCPAFDADDVVSHEWSHGYTQFTHGLIYAYQSGALNESYSDIFGEGVDLLNGADGIGGTNNEKPFPDGQRWLVGEDLGQEAQELLLRDMYDPDRLGDPGKVSSPNYACGNSDVGGVHTNSGVPNHAFAMIVDGTKFKPAVPTINQAAGTYNGQTITGIGLDKASAIYYRAQTVYQTPTTYFAQHDTAIQTSCSDLIGVPLKKLSTTTTNGAPLESTITAADCGEVAKAMLAVEMSLLPPCNFGAVLDDDPAPLCPGAQAFFSEDWETGDDGWTRTSQGYATGTADWENDRNPPVTGPHTIRDFKLVTNLPPGRGVGTAARAHAPPVGQPGGGTCEPGGDFSGSFSIDSPNITIPAGANEPLLVFDHWFAAEAGVDGGQIEISTDNGVTWTLVPKSAFVFNAYNNAYNDIPPLGNNTNPNPNEDAFTAFNVGIAEIGTWGTSIVNLGGLTNPGDTIKIRFLWSQDGCNGVAGWYIDNIKLVTCPNLPPPTLTVGNDYENPDTNGQFTLNWARPTGAVGPDLVQESQTSCGPVIFDNAEMGLTKWTTTTSGVGAQPWATSDMKPQHTSNTFFARGLEGVMNASSYLTYNDPITIPAVGQTVLNFLDWDSNESDDRVLVEVSEDNGTTWAPIYTHERSEAGTGAVGYATEPLFARSVNLANFGGKTIRLRFHYKLGGTAPPGSTPFGWYVDDIAIVNDNWLDVVGTGGTSTSLTRGSGSYCYRVRTNFILSDTVVPTPFSNLVNITVAPGVAAAVSRKAHTGGTYDIPLPLAGTAGIESRRGGGANTGNHQVVLSFGAPATAQSASVTPGAGKNAEVESVTSSGNEIVVNLRNVDNEQLLTVNLVNVNDGTGTRNISVPMGVLLGDVTADRSVNVGDAQQMRNRSGQFTDITNFRYDVNLDGSVNSGDAIIVRANSGKGF